LAFQAVHGSGNRGILVAGEGNFCPVCGAFHPREELI
jgi:hypothetical protein